ncbi:Kinesin-like protein KIF13A [Triplophysa tibetana]|uniref:Kinesin-like protein KIF13A n=1 Tax=Triplophysa tibetana TaxID=1572043 RepID=A0A5A9NPI8_9TELE|nr:Kinesin-like protein KIF13A [Triplophysa tibetana]
MGDTNLNNANVKVAVRLRPMNRREKDLNTKCVVEMEGNQTFLYPANLGKDSRPPPGTQDTAQPDTSFGVKRLPMISVWFDGSTEQSPSDDMDSLRICDCVQSSQFLLPV